MFISGIQTSNQRIQLINEDSISPGKGPCCLIWNWVKKNMSRKICGSPAVPAGHLGEWPRVQLHTTAALSCQVFCQKGRPNIIIFPYCNPVVLPSPCAWLGCLLTRLFTELFCELSPFNTGSDDAQHQAEGREVCGAALGADGRRKDREEDIMSDRQKMPRNPVLTGHI